VLYFNNYNRDAEQAKLLAEYAAQRERMETVRVLEAEVMTLEDIAEHAADYESDIEDREFWRKGQW
jgi:hypothetical protein